MGLLEKQLNERFATEGIRVEVVAWGRGGQNVIHRLNWVVQKFRIIDPDIVITLEGINDLAFIGGDRVFTFEDVQAATRGEFRSWRGSTWLTDWLALNSHLYQRLRVALAKSPAGQDTLDWRSENLRRLRENYRAMPVISAPRRRTDRVSTFGATLRTYLETLREHTGQILVLSQAVLWNPEMPAAERNSLWFPIRTLDGDVRPSPAWVFEEMRRFNAEQQRTAASVGAAYLDLDSIIPKDSSHFVDDCHYTDLGARKVANALEPQVAQAIGRVMKSRQ